MLYLRFCRDLLLALFDKLRVFEDADGVGIESDPSEMNETLNVWQARHFLASQVAVTNEKKRASRISAEGSLTPASVGLNEPDG